MATGITVGILIIIVYMIIRYMVKSRKSGKNTCSGSCHNCNGCR